MGGRDFGVMDKLMTRRDVNPVSHVGGFGSRCLRFGYWNTDALGLSFIDTGLRGAYICTWRPAHIFTWCTVRVTRVHTTERIYLALIIWKVFSFLLHRIEWEKIEITFFRLDDRRRVVSYQIRCKSITRLCFAVNLLSDAARLINCCRAYFVHYEGIAVCKSCLSNRGLLALYSHYLRE